MIKIVYAGNDKMFDGLYLSILSILRRTKENISFYLLSCDCLELKPSYTIMNDFHGNIIKELVKSYNKNNTFEIINCKNEYEKLIKNNVNRKSHYSPYASLRLLIDCYKQLFGKVLYLDIDTMAVNDINEFYKFDLGDNEFAVAHDRLGRHWQYKDCFNSGVILFNVDKCRENKLFEKSRNYLNTKKMYFPDQSALNLSKTKFMFFPGDDTRFNLQSLKIKNDTVIKHFCAIIKGWPLHNNFKQWNIEGVHKHYKIHTFDDDYKIYLDMKKKNNNDDNSFVSIKNLRKSYGNLKAVNNISFNVKKGSLFAFLGINGAGKSTTINIISSTLKKDSGVVKIGGFDLDTNSYDIKKMIGIVFQNSVLDNLLTVEENLQIRGKFYGMKKEELKNQIKRVTELLKLEPILKQPVGKLSGGQKRRVDIARALIHEPKLLMLDEPTTGLDPKTRLDVWHLIDDIRVRTNMTVFLTTHYLEEAEKATYVVIMNKGNIITEGTPVELKNKFSSDYVIVYKKQDKDFEKKIKGYKFVYDKDSNAYKISVKDSKTATEFLTKFKSIISDYEVKKGNMDDVFLNVTGEKK